MPISGTTTDYTGRKKDLSIMSGTDPKSTERQPVTLKFGAVSSFCAGIQKLIQKYMIYFTTIAGTQSQYPDFGTDFMIGVQNGNIRTREDIVHAFNFANLKTLEALKAYQKENPTIPTDEQINTASLDNLEVNGDKLVIDIRIVSNAGTDVVFLMPLPIQRK